MSKTLKILAIDLGRNYGWCFKHGQDEESGHAKFDGLMDWGKQFKDLIHTWKPDIVVLSQTNNFGFWNATRAAMLQAGTAFYIAGYSEIPGVELNDSSARKAVFGKAIKKKEVQNLMPGIQADELDAIILARGWHKLNQDGEKST